MFSLRKFFLLFGLPDNPSWLPSAAAKQGWKLKYGEYLTVRDKINKRKGHHVKGFQPKNRTPIPMPMRATAGGAKS